MKSIFSIKKAFLVILLPFTLISCTNNIQSKPKFEAPKYNISQESFTNKIKNADSIAIGYAYEAKSNFFSDSSVNKLSIELYYSSDKQLDDNFMKKQFQDIKKNAKQEIQNLKEYDVLELKIFNKKSEIKEYEEFIKK